MIKRFLRTCNQFKLYNKNKTYEYFITFTQYLQVYLLDLYGFN